MDCSKAEGKDADNSNYKKYPSDMKFSVIASWAHFQTVQMLPDSSVHSSMSSLVDVKVTFKPVDKKSCILSCDMIIE